MVHRTMILFRAMTGPATIRESRRRSPHSAVGAGAARTHRGTPATTPALPKRHRRERAKARPGLVGLYTSRPGHRGRDSPARDRTGAHPAVPGVPHRHRAPASGRPDLRRRLQKTCSRGCCAAGLTRYPEREEEPDGPIRRAQARLDPPGHLPGRARRAGAPSRRNHRRGRCTPTRGQRCPMLEQVHRSA